MQVFERLRSADLVIADVTDGNPNVMYELGLRHAIGGCVIQLGDYERLPFDLSIIRTIKVVRTEAGLIRARRELEGALLAAIDHDCPPVTATQVLRRAAGATLVIDEKSEPEEAESELGFLEILAEMEDALPRFNGRILEQGRIIEELGRISREGSAGLQAANAERGGFRARTAIVAKAAGRMNIEAEKLEVSVEAALRDLDAIDRGVSYLVGQVEEKPALLAEFGDFPNQVAQLAESAQGSVRSASGLAEAIQRMEQSHREMRPPVRRLVATLRSARSYAEVMERWRTRFEALGGAQAQSAPIRLERPRRGPGA